MNSGAIRRFALSVVLALAAAQPAQARSTPMTEFGAIVLIAPQGQAASTAAVRQAILEAATARMWLTLDDKPGRLLLRFSKGGGKHSATIEATYDAASMRVRYVDSVNLNHEVKDGKAVIHPTYNKWIEDLIKGTVVLHGRGAVAAAVPRPAASAPN